LPRTWARGSMAPPLRMVAAASCSSDRVASVLCVHQIIRVSDYPLGFGYPRVLVLGMNSHPNGSSGRVQVSVLGAQTLHPNRTRPVAIPGPDLHGMNWAARGPARPWLPALVC
jgi:hypothetical protein